MTTWTRAHERLLSAYIDLYRALRRRGVSLRSLDGWLARKFKTELMTVNDLTPAQARQARRCLRAWAWSMTPAGAAAWIAKHRSNG